MIMHLFEHAYKNAYNNLNENHFPPNSLDPQVFYFTDKGSDPVLMPAIKNQILNDIHFINQTESEFTQMRVWDYVLTGPILDKDSSENCSIIIKVQINKANLDDLIKENILRRMKEINDRLAIGTKHPIVYIPTIRKIEIEKLNAGYHPFTQRWLKKPSFLEESNKSAKDASKIKQKPKHSLLKGLRKLEGA
jgi:hypothetical protein